MSYTPVHAVWELTYACNMRCKHCGSGCGVKYPDELTTTEALALCDDLAGLGLQILTLSGGEPFLRTDWPLLARRLTDNGISTNVISNGWYVDELLLAKAHEAGIVNIGVSLDGLEATHDFIRKEGSYNRVMSALEMMHRQGMPSCVNTSVNRRNLAELPRLKEVLKARHVGKWQFQLATPMGNLLEHRELIMEPAQIEELVDFIHGTMLEGGIEVYLGDDIGYYTHKDMQVRRISAGREGGGGWTGCHAGKSVLGIRANGDIVGCLSIRNERFIEDNIRRVPLQEIWTRPDAFSWNRDFDPETLTGFCRKCQYNLYCKGGCGGAKICFNESLHENRYCTYYVDMEKLETKIAGLDDATALVEAGQQCVGAKAYQIAEMYFARALSLEPANTQIKALLGFTHYFLRNYSLAAEFNREVLQVEPQNAYAHKGLGLSLVKSGQADRGLTYLFKSVELEPDCADYYLDLAATLHECNQTNRALEVLHQMRIYSSGLKEASENMYNALKQALPPG